MFGSPETHHIPPGYIFASTSIPAGVIYPTGMAQHNRGMDIYEIRLLNLRRLAESEGSVAALARKLDMSYPLLNNYIGKNPTKRVGDVPVRRAEAVFRLPSGCLDRPIDIRPVEHLSQINSAWPFGTKRERFEQLPKSEKDRIDRFITDTVETWEATQEVRQTG